MIYLKDLKENKRFIDIGPTMAKWPGGRGQFFFKIESKSSNGHHYHQIYPIQLYNYTTIPLYNYIIYNNITI